MRKTQRGFTLIELAIVLVIVGLLLGGILKGSELMTAARVRGLVQQQDEIRTAYFGFVDRYGGVPGDYVNAVATIAGVAATPACNNGNGDGDGRIETGGNENLLVWEHLSKSGFLQTEYACAAAQSDATSPKSRFGQYLDIVYDTNYGGSAGVSRNSLKTGAQVPSDILAEIDRKIDDGNALQGSFRAQVGGGVTPTTADCYSAQGEWLSSSAGPNCGGALLF